jgi:D-alanyl-D-alanine carboxypeptidase (penicillin-binding protein 5/6)
MRLAVTVAGALGMASVGVAVAAAAPAVVHRRERATTTVAPSPLAALDARAFVLVLWGSGRIIYAQNANEELPIASTTKLMTAYVTLQREPLGRMLVEQPYDAEEGESLAPVPAGTSLSVSDMLRAMLLPSGNNVAYSLALDVAGSESAFVALMNRDAAELGLGRTHYSTPVGLDTPGNYSTPYDLSRLARILMRNAVFRSIVDEPSARLADGIVVDNRNDLVGEYPWIVGVKTGNTAEAGECLVAAARLGGVRLISVVLGTPSEAARDADTLALLRYGLGVYRAAKISVRGRVYATVPVTGRTQSARLVATRSSTLVLARATALHVSLDVPVHLLGPLAAGTPEGSLAVTENGRIVETVPLVTAGAVPGPRVAAAHRRAATATPRHRLVWYAAAGGLAIVLLGCSLPGMRRRVVRGASELWR